MELMLLPIVDGLYYVPGVIGGTVPDYGPLKTKPCHFIKHHQWSVFSVEECVFTKPAQVKCLVSIYFAHGKKFFCTQSRFKVGNISKCYSLTSTVSR